MALKRCENGHYYDPKKHSTCPSCGIPDLELPSKTTPRRPDPHRPQRRHPPPVKPMWERRCRSNGKRRGSMPSSGGSFAWTVRIGGKTTGSPSATPPGPGSVLPPVTTSHPPAVEELVQRLAAVSGRVTHQLGRILPRIAMPSVFDPTMATVAAVVAGLIGLLGAVWSFNELLGLSPGAQIFAAFLPGLVLVNKAQLLAGLMTDSALLVGAIQWMRKDVRGPVIVWGFAWVLLGLCVLGMLVIPVFGPFTTSWGQLQAFNRGQLVGGAISLGFRGLVPTAILVLLMWKGGGARPVAKGS